MVLSLGEGREGKRGKGKKQENVRRKLGKNGRKRKGRERKGEGKGRRMEANFPPIHISGDATGLA